MGFVGGFIPQGVAPGFVMAGFQPVKGHVFLKFSDLNLCIRCEMTNKILCTIEKFRNLLHATKSTTYKTLSLVPAGIPRSSIEAKSRDRTDEGKPR